VVSIEPTKTITRPIYRVEPILHFSERRLLLFLGDLLMLLLAGWGAFWLHAIVK
jgi:hypothetical protein